MPYITNHDIFLNTYVRIFFKYNGFGWVASPLTLAELSLPCCLRVSGLLWAFFLYHLPLYSGIVGGYYAHTCVDRTIRAAGRPAGPSGTCLPPHGPLKDTQIIGAQWSWTVLLAAIVIFNSKASNGPPCRPVKNGQFLVFLPLTTWPNGGLPLGYCISGPLQEPACLEACGDAAWLKIAVVPFFFHCSANNLHLIFLLKKKKRKKEIRECVSLLPSLHLW